jgi:hypothetical protein
MAVAAAIEGRLVDARGYMQDGSGDYARRSAEYAS